MDPLTTRNGQLESSITERYPKQVLSFCFEVEVYPKHSNDNTPKLTQDSPKSLLWSHTGCAAATDQPRSTQSRHSIITWAPSTVFAEAPSGRWQQQGLRQRTWGAAGPSFPLSLN